MTELDRYDYAISWLMAVAAAGALVLGAPLWVIVLICIAGSCVVFIRHIDEFRVK
jgi:Flp pilus assembly protein TadB